MQKLSGTARQLVLSWNPSRASAGRLQTSSQDVFRFALVGIVILATGTTHAQQQCAADAQAEAEAPASTNQWFVRGGYSAGRVLAASEFQSGGNGARAVTVEIGRQTDGTRDWHRVYNFPSYGVGFYAASFDHERELGHPVAMYGFFSWPFPVSSRAQVTTDLGLGLSWNWNAYDPRTNPANTALGSAAAYHVDVGLLLQYLASERARVYAGVNVTHWSNGGTRQPNLGLLAVGPKVGVRYNFAPQVARARVRRADLPPFVPAWEFLVGAAGSSRNVVARTNLASEGVDRRRDFAALNITTGIERHFYRFGKIAAGADVTYDGSAGARVDVVDGRQAESRAPVDQRLALGVYSGYEHVIARFSVLLQLGYTIWRGFEDEDVPRFYQRYGVRFHFSDHVWGTFAVRSVKLRKAAFMELGLGYRVRWR